MLKTYYNLFKGLPVKEKSGEFSKSIYKETGVLVDKAVIKKYTKPKVLKLISEVVLSDKQINSTFHKSWKKVRDADIDQLVAEQVIHYFTTYGLQALGLADDSLIFIPNEKLKLPKEYKSDIPVLILDTLSKDELKERFDTYLYSSMAYSKETIDDILKVVGELDIKVDVNQVKNKELYNGLCILLDILPKDPIEFIRMCVNLATGKTLLIKNQKVLDELKIKNSTVAIYWKDYIHTYGYESLASIFYRFKPFFLAFGNSNKEIKKIVNKVRRLAPKFHKPMKEDIIGSLTSKIRKGEKIDLNLLAEKLEKTNNYRKVRLYQALGLYENSQFGSFLYRIRNGKSFVKKGEGIKKVPVGVKDLILSSIVNTVGEKVKDKTIYLGQGIISAPSSGKLFVGDVPFGSSFETEKSFTTGVYWENVGSRCVDLDLSMISLTAKVGWDSSYRNESFLFSGDITNAPKGATEAFFVNKDAKDGVYLLQLNYYNGYSGNEVPYTLFVSDASENDIMKNRTGSLQKTLFQATSTITGKEKQKSIGVIRIEKGIKTFYLFESADKGMITSQVGGTSTKKIKYYMDYLKNLLPVEEILRRTGATIVGTPEEADIDLSVNNLTKDKLIELFE